MARLYADEDVPEDLNQLLRGLGHDVLSVDQAGKKAAAILPYWRTRRRTNEWC
ncbi:MAG: hypothetical protein U0793_24575 [Gemmataceae bacterium]